MKNSVILVKLCTCSADYVATCMCDTELLFDNEVVSDGMLLECRCITGYVITLSVFFKHFVLTLVMDSYTITGIVCRFHTNSLGVMRLEDIKNSNDVAGVRVQSLRFAIF